MGYLSQSKFAPWVIVLSMSQPKSYLNAGDLRRAYKDRRLRQIQFVKDHPDMAAETLARIMLERGIYSPKAGLDQATRRVVYERANPGKIGPPKKDPGLSLEQLQSYASSLQKKKVVARHGRCDV